jgi:hypothetical protein
LRIGLGKKVGESLTINIRILHESDRNAAMGTQTHF